MGHTQAAVQRLLAEADRHGNDPELFAGLVHACRYCGLFEQSIAAHEEARRLDPNVATSLEQTLLMMGDTERLMGVQTPPVVAGVDDGIRVIGLGLAGRTDEARRLLTIMRQAIANAGQIRAFEPWTDYLLAWLDRRPSGMLDSITTLSALKIRDDPEAMFQEGWLLCDVGEHERGLVYLRRAVDKGYFAVPTLANHASFGGVRGNRVFQQIRADAEAGQGRALAAFREADGERLLGR